MNEPQSQPINWTTFLRNLVVYVLIALGGGAAGGSASLLCQPCNCKCQSDGECKTGECVPKVDEKK